MWRALTDDPGNVAGTDLLSATEPFIGAIDSDGVTLRIVETDDPGIMFGEVLGPNELEMAYMESYPHAVVYTVVLRRNTEGLGLFFRIQAGRGRPLVELAQAPVTPPKIAREMRMTG